MNLLEQLKSMGKNLASLGQAKLALLAEAGVVTLGLVLAAAFFVNKPAYETLYVGLESTDMNQISVALAEANIDLPDRNRRRAACWFRSARPARPGSISPSAACRAAPIPATSCSTMSARSA